MRNNLRKPNRDPHPPQDGLCVESKKWVECLYTDH